MRKHYLAVIVSIVFVLGLTSTAMAVSDTTGENIVPNVDLASASVQTFAPQGPSVPPEYVKLGIRMHAGSHLPALIIWDFDVDNDTGTGGGSRVTGIPNDTCGGGVCKADAGGGFDFYVVMALRDQADDSSTALCGNCTGSAVQCAERGAPTSCNEGICYELGTSCNIGDPGCYEVTTECTGCSGGPAYPLDQICGTTTEACGMGLLKGEWYMSIGTAVKPYERGRSFLPVSWSETNYTQWCFTLPWNHIITRASSKGADFDYDYTKSNPPKFQVSIYYDEAFSDGDDLFTFSPGVNLNISDWLPNTARVADGDFNQYSTCIADLDGNSTVDAADVALMLTEYGRWQFYEPCPSCQY